MLDLTRASFPCCISTVITVFRGENELILREVRICLEPIRTGHQFCGALIPVHVYQSFG